MTRIGATGHQDIPTEALPYLTEGVRSVIRSCQVPLHAVTALAVGADQLVAREALAAGATLHAIIPSAGYESTFSSEAKATYLDLLAKADKVTRLKFAAPTEDAFWAAGRTVVDECDVLIAIWDGRAAHGLGGTGDVVRYASSQRRDVRIIWPSGAVRG